MPHKRGSGRPPIGRSACRSSLPGSSSSSSPPALCVVSRGGNLACEVERLRGFFLFRLFGGGEGGASTARHGPTQSDTQGRTGKRSRRTRPPRDRQRLGVWSHEPGSGQFGEAGDALGRDYYEHGAQPGQGYRNGYRTGRLKTAEGLMEYSAPQIAGREEPFHSATSPQRQQQKQQADTIGLKVTHTTSR